MHLPNVSFVTCVFVCPSHHLSRPSVRLSVHLSRVCLWFCLGVYDNRQNDLGASEDAQGTQDYLQYEEYEEYEEYEDIPVG